MTNNQIDWIDRHSITCHVCGKLADEREAIQHPSGEGEIGACCKDRFENCDECDTVLEEGRIGLCDSCYDEDDALLNEEDRSNPDDN